MQRSSPVHPKKRYIDQGNLVRWVHNLLEGIDPRMLWGTRSITQKLMLVLSIGWSRVEIPSFTTSILFLIDKSKDSAMPINGVEKYFLKMALEQLKAMYFSFVGFIVYWLGGRWRTRLMIVSVEMKGLEFELRRMQAICWLYKCKG